MAWFLTLVLASSVFTGSPLTTTFDSDLAGAFAPPAAVSQDETEVTEQVFPINADGKIEVSNINGSIEIEAWDRSEVKLVSKKVANSRERLSDIEVKVTSSAERLKVEVDYKRWQGKWVKGDSLYVNFSMMVPRNAVLDDIETVNGGVKVLGTENVTKVSAVNGSVRGSELRGNVQLETVNGSVIAEFKTVTAGSAVSLNTVNGSAEIRVPSNADITVKADSVNGSITNGFGLPVKKGQYTGRYLYGRVGTGSSMIKLNSVNGSLKISRLDDGLPIGPIENLLPSKTADDFDDAFNGRFEFPDVSAQIAAVEARRALVVEAGRGLVEGAEAAKVKVDIDKDAVRQSAKIAADAARVSSEAVESALSSMELAELAESEMALESAKINSEAVKSAVNSAALARIDERRLAAELARIRQNVFARRATPYLVEDSKTVKVTGIPTIEVKAAGANVSVKAWDKNEVKYTVSRIARGVESPVENIIFNEKKNIISLEVRLSNYEAADDLLEQVMVELFVPGKANLDIKTNREIRVQGVTGDLKLTGKAGTINVRDSGGSLDVSSKTALVRVIGFDGNVDATGYSGDLYLEGSFRRISSKMDSGEVFLTVSDDSAATIRTNQMYSKGKISNDGKKLIIDGLELEKTGDGIWKIGSGGKAEYEFLFTTGKLRVRPFKSISSE